MAAQAKTAVEQHLAECVEANRALQVGQAALAKEVRDGFQLLHDRISSTGRAADTAANAVKNELEAKIAGIRKRGDDWIAWAFRLLLAGVAVWTLGEVMNTRDYVATVKRTVADARP